MPEPGVTVLFEVLILLWLSHVFPVMSFYNKYLVPVLFLAMACEPGMEYQSGIEVIPLSDKERTVIRKEALSVAHADIRSAGNMVFEGSAIFTQAKNSDLRLNMYVSQAEPGKYLVYISEAGDCGPLPVKNKTGHHGFIGSFDVRHDGTGTLEMILPGRSLSGEADTNAAGKVLKVGRDAVSEQWTAWDIGCGIIKKV